MDGHALSLRHKSAKPKTLGVFGRPSANRAVRNILHDTGIQPKLRLGAVDDPAEAEADRIADQVMRMPEPAAGSAAPAAPSSTGTPIRCLCADCESELQRMPGDREIRPMEEDEDEVRLKRSAETIQRLCPHCAAEGPESDSARGEEAARRQANDDEEIVQTKQAPGDGPHLSPASESLISGLRGGGVPLPAAERAFFEPRLGRDLGEVRIHDGPAAADASRSINARAFTLGSDVAFARGEYRPGATEGRRLIAHELAHVVGHGAGEIRRDVFDDALFRSLSEDELERLTTPNLERLLNDLRAAIQPESSPENDGLISNMTAVEGVLIDRYNRESSEHAAPDERSATAESRGLSASQSSPEEFSTDDLEPGTGAYAAASGYSLEHVDSGTHWESEESRDEFQQSYLEWTQENNDELYVDALDYLYEQSQQKVRDARDAAIELESAELQGDIVSAVVAETGLDREFVEGFLTGYSPPRHPGVINPHSVPFIQISAPRFAIASILKDFIPGVGIYEGITGRDVLTNRELATWERVLGGVLDLLPLAARAVSGPARFVARGTARLAVRSARSIAALGHGLGRSLRSRHSARAILRFIGRLGNTSPEAISDLLDRIQAARRAGRSLRLTRQERRLMQDVFGTGGRSGGGRRATLHQRQRAAALREEAEMLERRAARFDDNASRIEAARPEGARRARQNAEDLRASATARRTEAEEFASGRRSATADLPGPEDFSLDALRAEQPMVRIGLTAAERAGEYLPRIARGLSHSRSGHRVLFRVEGGGSRSRVIIDASGNVTLRRGATIHFNFGSLERAQEFLLKRNPGSRIIAFEVEEGWVRSARSAAIPEGGTARIRGRQPRLVDVTYADDQMEIPAGLLADMEEFIVQGSGRVVQVNP